MHHGCVAGANGGREGSGGVVADIAKLSIGREAYSPASGSFTRFRACCFTVGLAITRHGGWWGRDSGMSEL